MRKRAIRVVTIVGVFAVLLASSMLNDEEPVPIDRESKIPEEAVKVKPEEDGFPPILHSHEYEEPVPMPGPINTAGGEDSPFITPDGNSFYFFFTPSECARRGTSHG